MSDESALAERDPIADKAFRALLDLYMVSDPWPLDDVQKGIVFGFLTAEAHKRDFTDITEAYHEFDLDDER
jgi:hypothetical protein